MKQRKIGSLLGYINTVLHALITIIYIKVLLARIGDFEYGLYQIVGSVTSYLSLLGSPLSNSILRYYSNYKEDNNIEGMENTLAIGKKLFFTISIIMLIILIPVIFIFINAYSNTLTTVEIKESIYMLFITTLSIAFTMNNYIYIAAINANERFIFIKVLGTIELCLQPVIVISIIKRFPYAVTISIFQLIFTIALCFTRKHYADKYLKLSVKYHNNDYELVKRIIGLSLSILIVNIADQIFWKTDQLILGAKEGVLSVSIYSVGASIHSSFMSIGYVIPGVVLPKLTRLSKENNELIVSDFFIKICRYQMIVLGLVLGGIILFGKELILIIAGTNYSSSYYVALLLTIPYFIDLIESSGNVILELKEKYYYRSLIMIVVAIINVFLTLFLVEKMGIIGAALGTTISILLGSGILMNIVYKRIAKINVKKFIYTFVYYCLLIVISVFIGEIFNRIIIENIYIQFFVHVIMFTIFYSLFIVLFGLRKNEKEYIKEKGLSLFNIGRFIE